jgi:predicted RNase H-like HicB family nuclease
MRPRKGYCSNGINTELSINLTLKCEQVVVGSWLVEVPELPGALTYGRSSTDEMSKAEVLAHHVIADQLENGEAEPVSIQFSLPLSE